MPTINGSEAGIVVTGGTSPPPGPPPPPGTLVSKLGVVNAAPSIRTATVVLDSNGNGTFDSGDAVFGFGLSTVKFITGDWNNLGFDSLGVVRQTIIGFSEQLGKWSASGSYSLQSAPSQP